MIKAVFFDLYHTLIQYTPPREESLAKTLRLQGIEVSAERLRRPIVSGDEYFYLEAAKRSLSKRTETERQAFWANYQAVVLTEAGLEPRPALIAAILAGMNNVKYDLILFDDVMPALASLEQRGLTLGLVSNVDKDISPMLDRLGLSARLKVKVTSCEVGWTKPDPAIFKEAARRSGVSPPEMLFVGDQYQIDVLGARAAGLKALLLDRHGYFSDVPASEKIHGLNEIADRL